MTTRQKKQAEEGYVIRFLDGFIEHTAIEPHEKPDFWVRRTTGPDIGLEVTEYHPEAQDVSGARRAEVEAHWWKELEPRLDRERQARPSLEGVRLSLQFKDPSLPRRKEQDARASEVVRLAEEVAASHPTSL